MKTLKFRKELSKLILVGKKNTTWRLFDDKNLAVGDEVDFVVSETGEAFARVKIVFVKETTFGALSEKDWEGHEKYETDEAMYKVFEAYYHCTVDDNSSVKIIKFELL